MPVHVIKGDCDYRDEFIDTLLVYLQEQDNGWFVYPYGEDEFEIYRRIGHWPFSYKKMVAKGEVSEQGDRVTMEADKQYARSLADVMVEPFRQSRRVTINRVSTVEVM